MTLKFSLDAHDYLLFQLYTASKSEGVRKKRRRTQVMFPILYVGFAAMFLSEYRFISAGVFFGLALGWFFLYPLWEKGHYVRHYRRFIHETYKNSIGKEGSLEFGKDYLLAKEDGIESKMPLTEIESFNEIDQIIFIKLKSAHSFIIPKNKLENPEMVISNLKEIAAKIPVDYYLENDWKWK